MSSVGVQAQFYLGVVAKEGYKGGMDYKITADIPGVIQGVTAYPLRGDCDEPKPGDPIILLGLDPEYNSYYLYWKLKENDFTGFRIMGQQISFDEDEGIRISIDGRTTAEDSPNFPADDKRLPGEVSRIDLDLNGNITAKNMSGAEITLDKDGDVFIKPGDSAGVTILSSGGTIKLGGNGVLDLGNLTTMTGAPTETGFIATNAFGEPGSPIPTTSKVHFTR